MHGGRVLSVLVTLASIAALAAPASASAAIWNPTADGGDGCIERSGIDEYDVVDRRPYLEIYARGRAVPVAERSAHIIRGERIWSTLAAELGQPRREPAPGGGRELPYRLFVTGEPIDAAGLVDNYCGETTFDAALVAADLEGRELGATLAHELFHSFANGVAGELASGWWAETTATWAEVQLYRSDAQVTRLDRQFIQRPADPIDRFLADPDFADRPYGAWRFVQWLEGYLGGADGVWGFLDATYRRIGAGADNTIAVTDELDARGRSFGEDLGHFWGDHLRPTNPLNGPATDGEEVRFPTEEPAAGDPSVDVEELEAVNLGADVVRLRLPRDSHVQQIEITAGATTPESYLWVQNGRDLEDWTIGGSARFCVGGASPATGAKAWPGQFPVAFTNGKRVGSSLTHQVTVRVSAEECEGLVPDPAAAVDESPVLDLPDRCPRAPSYFSPPPRSEDPADGFHTDYYVFRERLTDIYETHAAWQQAAVARVENRDLGRRAAGRLLARWYFCTSNRVRGLDHLPGTDAGPDEMISRWRGQLAARLRQAAQRLERGEFPFSTINAASLTYVNLITRCTVQDVATAE
ncbi:MAG TPA: hypothetical protein VFY99_04310 [Solirubrobacterales bacterium]